MRFIKNSLTLTCLIFFSVDDVPFHSNTKTELYETSFSMFGANIPVSKCFSYIKCL